MSNIKNNLEEKYDEYLDLLSVLCSTYDSLDKEVLALPISTAIRVLVHDTEKSTSLLKHLGKKDIEFLSTNYEISNESVHLGLVRRINAGVNNGIGGEARYWPLCSEKYFPMPNSKKSLIFINWWEREVIFSLPNSSLTRKDLVLAVANKDGGAHFESTVKKNYDDYRHSYSGGSTLVGIKSGVKRGYDNIPIYPAIRQIAYELLRTLKP